MKNNQISFSIDRKEVNKIRRRVKMNLKNKTYMQDLEQVYSILETNFVSYKYSKFFKESIVTYSIKKDLEKCKNYMNEWIYNKNTVKSWIKILIEYNHMLDKIIESKQKKSKKNYVSLKKKDLFN